MKNARHYWRWFFRCPAKCKNVFEDEYLWMSRKEIPRRWRRNHLTVLPYLFSTIDRLTNSCTVSIGEPLLRLSLWTHSLNLCAARFLSFLFKCQAWRHSPQSYPGVYYQLIRAEQLFRPNDSRVSYIHCVSTCGRNRKMSSWRLLGWFVWFV